MRSEQFLKIDLLPFAEMRYSRGSDIPFKLHMHRTLSIGAVVRGEVFYNVGGKETLLAPGSLAVINPETLHACNPANEAGRSFYMLFLDPTWCLRVQQSMWDISAFVDIEKTKIDDEPLYKQYCKTMRHLMDEKIHLQKKEELLFDVTCSVFLATCSPRTLRKENHKGIEKLKKLLSTDLQNDLPLNLLAKDLDANPYTLIRRFKAFTGITPHNYRMNCRIEQAKTYLRQGKDIVDTALECGFFDQSHFHRHFKAMTAVTPQEYRVNFVQ